MAPTTTLGASAPRNLAPNTAPATRAPSAPSVAGVTRRSGLDEFDSFSDFVARMGDPTLNTERNIELLARAYATSGDVAAGVPAWVARDLTLIGARRPVLEAFAHKPLPDQGQTIAYPVSVVVTGSVAEQIAEGDALSTLKVSAGSLSAPVRTFGASAEISVQARRDPAYAELVHTVSVTEYAKATATAVRSVLTSLSGTNTQTLAFADRGKASSWQTAGLDAAEKIEDNAFGDPAASVWIMPRAVWRVAAAIADTNNVNVFALNNDPTIKIGNSPVRAWIAGLPILVDRGMTGTFSYVAAREALTVLESSPFDLSSVTALNAAQQRSLHGYLAVTANDPKAITKVSHPAA